MADEVCPDCNRPVLYDGEPDYCAASLLHHDTGDYVSCLQATVANLRTQLKAAEAGLHRAWNEGRAAGWRDRIDRGNDERTLPPKLTENPYPEVK